MRHNYAKKNVNAGFYDAAVAAPFYSTPPSAIKKLHERFPHEARSDRLCRLSAKLFRDGG